MLTIKKGDYTKIAPNFTANEFYSTSSDAPDSHPLSPELVEAVQFLRAHFGVAWGITSTFRTKAHELRLSRAQGKTEAQAQSLAKNSQHCIGRAVDSQPKTDQARIMQVLNDDISAKGPIYHKLRTLGINGFGLYNTFIHLDTRTTGGLRKDSLGEWAFWDNRPGSTKKATPSLTKKMSLAASVCSHCGSPLLTSHGK